MGTMEQVYFSGGIIFGVFAVCLGLMIADMLAEMARVDKKYSRNENIEKRGK